VSSLTTFPPLKDGDGWQEITLFLYCQRHPMLEWQRRSTDGAVREMLRPVGRGPINAIRDIHPFRRIHVERFDH
jgi:hypothetical protein